MPLDGKDADGDDIAALSLTPPQPGGRAVAPGRIALLQAFENTHFDLVSEFGSDMLATPRDLARWLTDHRLIDDRPSLTVSDFERALVVREGLRALIASHEPAALGDSGVVALNQALAGASLELRLTAGGARLVPAGQTAIDRALGQLIEILSSAMLDGSWLRLKVCPGSHCGWVFYDYSRNNSGRWCSMRVCGGRAKVRAHYRRKRGG